MSANKTPSSFLKEYFSNMKSTIEEATIIKAPLKNEEIQKNLQKPKEVWWQWTIEPKNSTRHDFYTIINPVTVDKQKALLVLQTTYLKHKLQEVYDSFYTTASSDLKDYRKFIPMVLKNEKFRILGSFIGDSLYEANPEAIEAYKAFLPIRSTTDIPVKEFPNFFEQRNLCAERPDECWLSLSSSTLYGYMIKQLEENLFYIIVAEKIDQTLSFKALYSFPTNDIQLVERHKTGELCAPELLQLVISH